MQLCWFTYQTLDCIFGPTTQSQTCLLATLTDRTPSTSKHQYKSQLTFCLIAFTRSELFTSYLTLFACAIIKLRWPVSLLFIAFISLPFNQVIISTYTRYFYSSIQSFCSTSSSPPYKSFKASAANFCYFFCSIFSRSYLMSFSEYSPFFLSFTCTESVILSAGFLKQVGQGQLALAYFVFSLKSSVPKAFVDGSKTLLHTRFDADWGTRLGI